MPSRNIVDVPVSCPACGLLHEYGFTIHEGFHACAVIQLGAALPWRRTIRPVGKWTTEGVGKCRGCKRWLVASVEFDGLVLNGLGNVKAEPVGLQGFWLGIAAMALAILPLIYLTCANNEITSPFAKSVFDATPLLATQVASVALPVAGIVLGILSLVVRQNWCGCAAIVIGVIWILIMLLGLQAYYASALAG